MESKKVINLENVKARFEKVSLEKYISDWKNLYGEEYTDVNLVTEFWNKLKTPSRSTKGSAAFDFYLPFQVNLPLKHTITIPTGFRCVLDEGYGLLFYPRSGQGFNYRLMIVNTVPVIDSDFAQSKKTEGHIMIKITYDGVYNQIGVDTTDYKLVEKLNEDTGETEKYHELNIYNKNIPVPSVLPLKGGNAYVQGIVTRVYGSENELENEVTKQRDGGFGSTGM